MKWRPIETAPTDGTFVLGCYWGPWEKEYEQWRAPHTISFRAFHPNAPGKKKWRCADGRPAKCTHWMSLSELPEPPEK